jgi:hypothetical protein
MKSIDDGLSRPPSRGRRGIVVTLAVTAGMAVVAAFGAGCGSSGGTPAAGQGGSTTAIQVLTPVQRGDLVETAPGRVKLVAANGSTTVVATVSKQYAASVAVGQTATLMFFRLRAGGQGGFPSPPAGSGGPSGAPFPQGGPSGAPFPQGGQDGSPFGQGGFGQGRLGGRGTPGTVAAVATSADGSVTATITVKTLPKDVTAKSVGFASIQTKVLASNVIIIPTAAIKGSGSSTTVQVLANGKSSTRTVVVGQQAGAESEIVSGLSVGENIVWERAFQRGEFFRDGGTPLPGQSGAPFGGGQPGNVIIVPQ